MSQGRIEKALSGFYYVNTGSGVLQCRARGKFRKEGMTPLVGDWVEVQELGTGEGIVQTIEPRSSEFQRPAAANVDQLVVNLSGGNQQKVVIAKWLENDPKILILNSPTVGVDIGSKADIHACARKLARQGMGVIIISDDISEIMQNCSRVLVMKKGRIVSEHKVSQLTEAELSQQLRED